jgi:hypothetical protein
MVRKKTQDHKLVLGANDKKIEDSTINMVLVVTT